MSAPPKDQSFTNLTVPGNLTSGRIVSRIARFDDVSIENLTNDDLQTASMNNGLQYNDIQIQTKNNTHRNFMIHNTILQLTAGDPLPTFAPGRTVTFNNMTSIIIQIYVTEGYPNAKGPTLIPGGGSVAPGGSVVWPIPTTPGWNGNFRFGYLGSQINAGVTLAEFGFNQLWSGATPPLRETFDISTVPPGIGNECNDGPHETCVQFSQQSGFNELQSTGYNIGVRITPPVSVTLPSQVVTCTEPSGDCLESVGFPNDTAFPKQQTIDYMPAMNYIVDILDPASGATGFIG